MIEDDPQLLNVKKAAAFLGISRATIRLWAQMGKLKGVKLGTRGDWRFTKDELSKMIQIDEKKYTKIRKFLRTHAEEIQTISDKKHRTHLGQKHFRSEIIKKQKKSHVAIVKKLATNIEDTNKGELVFIRLGESLAKEAVKNGLTLEEAVDGTIFLKQAFWEKLKDEGLLYELTTQDLYSFSHIISTYVDIVAAKIAFAYHGYYRTEEERLGKEKKQFEEQVTQSERRYKNFIRLSREGIWRFELEKPIPVSLSAEKQIDLMYQYAYLAECNDATAKMYGLNKATDIIGARLGDMLVRTDAQNIAYLSAFIKKKYKLHDAESLEKDTNGNTRFFLNSLTGYVENGFLIRAWGTQRDITEKKQTEDTLTFQANVLKNITDSVITTDLSGKITYWNKGAEIIFGYSENEMLGKTPASLYPDLDVKQYAGDMKMILKGKDHHGEWKGMRKDGKSVWVSIKTTVLRDVQNNPIGFIGVANDITEGKAFEEALRESEERLRLAINAGNVGVWDWDIVNNKITWSDKIFEIHGVAREDFHNTPDDFLRQIYSEDVAFVTKRLEQALKDKKPYKLEFRAYGPNKQVIWIATSAQVVFNKKNKPVRMLGATIDITERKQAEKQKDEFIGLVSHELKTPVTSVKAFAQVLERSFAKRGEEKAALLLKKMDVQIDKLAVLISDLLDVTRIHEGKLAFRKDYFDFNELVKEITEEVQRTTDKHAIKTQLSPTKSIYGDRDRYGQVITNFLTNAIKYSPTDTKILVTTAVTNNELKLSVKDQGVGIPEDKQQHLFERFFRVSHEVDTYPGLGLGLYICKEIIIRQGGSISVESKVGKGSVFSFSIPLQPVETS